MTGKITVGTIQDTDGNTVASTYVTNGVAKAWAYIEGTGTPSITGSFNISGLTDEATAVVRANFTNNMNNTNFSNLGVPRENSEVVMIQELESTYVRATSSMVLKTHSTTASVDTQGRNYAVLGDLA
jgi:hypothetical protein